MTTILLLLFGIALLLVGGTALVRGASGIAGNLGISPLVVGLTVVAFGTSTPELVVNLVGAVQGETEIAFGNVAGSNLANLGLVLGSAALILPMTIQGQIIRREIPLLLLGTTALLVMILDGPLDGGKAILSRSDGLILLLLFGIFVYITVIDFLREDDDQLKYDIEEMESILPSPFLSEMQTNWIFIGAGVLGLTVGGQMTISYGSEFAEDAGMPPVVVGMVIVAVGTSLPELVTSIIAAIKRESDLCVGNVIGSNLFNCLFVLPLSALVRPLPVPEGSVLDIFLSLLLAAVIIPIFFYGEGRMQRKFGLVLVVVYLGYMTQRAMLQT